MSDLNLGRMRAANNGAQDSTLRSVKQVLVKSPTFKGNVDASAINLILSAITELQKNTGKYQLDLASANNDTLTEKIKFVVNELYKASSSTDDTASSTTAPTADEIDAIVKAAIAESAFATASTSTAETSEKDTSGSTDVEEALASIKDTIGEDESEKVADGEEFVNGEDGDYTNFDVAENFTLLQTRLSEQIAQFEKNTIDQFTTFSPHVFSIGTIPSMISGLGESILKGIASPFKAITSKISGLGKSILKGIASPFKAITSKISGLGKSMLGKLASPFKKVGAKAKSVGKKIGNVVTHPFKAITGLFKKSSKEKKAEKRQNSIFDSLEKLVKRLKKFANSTKEMILGLLAEIVIPAAKILARGIGIIMKPVLSFLISAFWGTGLGFLVVGIGLGIALIAMAVKKVVDFLVDDLGPTIKGWLEKISPETIERGLNTLIDIGNIITSVVSALFAPLIVIGTVIKAALEPIADFVKRVLQSFVDHVMPIIDKIFEIISGVILTILEAVQPAIMMIAKIIGGVIVTILEVIGPIIEAMSPLLKAIGDVVILVIQGATLLIQGIVTGVKMAIQYVRDNWDSFVAFVKNLPRTIIDFIKKLPSMILAGVKKIFQIGKAIGNWFKEKVKTPVVNKLLAVEWKLPFMDPWKPFGFLQGAASTTVGRDEKDGPHPDEVEMPAAEDIKSIEEQTSESQEVASEEAAKKAAEEKAEKEKKEEEFRQKLVHLLENLITFTGASFEDLSKKLDKQPDIMPLPIMQGANNQANMNPSW